LSSTTPQAGGIVTNLLGWQIEHVSDAYRSIINSSSSSSSSSNSSVLDQSAGYGNRLGVLITGPSFAARSGGKGHDDITALLLKEIAVQQLLEPVRGFTPTTAQASDVCRNIWGDPFTIAELQQAVYGSASESASSSKIVRWWCPEEDAVRYKQSHATRIRWHSTTAQTKQTSNAESEGEEGGEETIIEGSAFFKRIVMRELPSAIKKMSDAPFKLVRDMQANLNEAVFLSSTLPTLFNNSQGGGCGGCGDGGGGGGVVVGGGGGEATRTMLQLEIAIPYQVNKHVHPDIPIDSRFTLLLRDFSPEAGWKQYPHLLHDEMMAAMEALARWHSHYWIDAKPVNGSTTDTSAAIKCNLAQEAARFTIVLCDQFMFVRGTSIDHACWLKSSMYACNPIACLSKQV
jgi:hypothetical protein